MSVDILPYNTDMLPTRIPPQLITGKVNVNVGCRSTAISNGLMVVVLITDSSIYYIECLSIETIDCNSLMK